MQIYWYVYPHFGVITDDIIARLPFVPFSREHNFVSFVSPIWDTGFQEYIHDYFNGVIINNRIIFQEAFNSSFDLRVEFHGSGEFDLDHFTMRSLAEMNCILHIKHCT